MAIIINKLPQRLPTEPDPTYEEQQEYALLVQREHVPIAGNPTKGIFPLTAAEKTKLRAYKASTWLSKYPKWSGVEFPFAPAGEPGCALEVRDDVALFIVQMYNKGSQYVCLRPRDEILHVMGRDEELPAGVTAIRVDLEDPQALSTEGILLNGKYVEKGGMAPTDFSPAKLDKKDAVERTIDASRGALAAGMRVALTQNRAAGSVATP